MKVASVFAGALILSLTLPDQIQARKKPKPKPKFCVGKDGNRYSKGEYYEDEEACIRYTCFQKGKKMIMRKETISCEKGTSTSPVPVTSINQSPATTTGQGDTCGSIPCENGYCPWGSTCCRGYCCQHETCWCSGFGCMPFETTKPTDSCGSIPCENGNCPQGSTCCKGYCCPNETCWCSGFGCMPSGTTEPTAICSVCGDECCVLGQQCCHSHILPPQKPWCAKWCPLEANVNVSVLETKLQDLHNSVHNILEIVNVLHPQPVVRTRKNLSSLSEKEINDLKDALGKAKKSGTYSPTWPIKNGVFPNGYYFNSSYNAAVAFHGYPKLCHGFGCCFHYDPRFLPWHRLFMVQIEGALRQNKKYKDITLPYWDWTQSFTELPPLVTDNRTENPFYNSSIPGPGKIHYTERSGNVLVNYTHFGCPDASCDENKYTNFKGISKLGDLVLTALEEEDYVSFEAQIEHPHNQVHNQLGFTPNTPNCTQQGHCYPYTMQPLYYAAYDPIFLPFHTMVDYQWAIFQALQKYRCLGYPPETCKFAYKNDPHPLFTRELAPFNSDVYNQNEITRQHSTGQQVVNYTQSLGYKYDQLQLFGRNISELDTFLKERNNVDRLFAGFSLPKMYIQRITFNICHPITNCIYSSPHFSISKIHGNHEATTGVFQDTILTYFDVTKYLPHFGLNPSQDIGFKIVSSSIPTNVTFTHVSIFRKAKTKTDRITIHWLKDLPEYAYAPFFQTRPNRRTSVRFLLENGNMSVFQYPDRESFQSCSNSAMVSQEIEITGNQTFFFHNPLRPDCIEKNKIQISTSNLRAFSALHKYANGSGIIEWSEDMTKYTDGICMEPGTRLTFEWTDGYHNVIRLANKDDFKYCQNFTDLNTTKQCPGPDIQHPEITITYPPLYEGGFQIGEEYYMVCPCWNHCYAGMKLKINIKEQCPPNIY